MPCVSESVRLGNRAPLAASVCGGAPDAPDKRSPDASAWMTGNLPDDRELRRQTHMPDGRVNSGQLLVSAPVSAARDTHLDLTTASANKVSTGGRANLRIVFFGPSRVLSRVSGRRNSEEQGWS